MGWIEMTGAMTLGSSRALLLSAVLLFGLALITTGAAAKVFHKFEDGDVQQQGQGREVMIFDYGWRFHLGEPNGGGANFTCPSSSFPNNLSDVEIQGLHHTEAQTLETCRGSCCEISECEVWQWGGKPEEEHRGCWIGAMGPTDKSSSWQGGGRDVPGPTPPPATSGPTSRGYDDKAWEMVDVPHDGLISGVYSESASKSHGYLPFNTTWYRKHFNLPVEWKGESSIQIYFEGIFKSSTVFLNGQQIGSHASGYTSFAVRLDNVSAILYGDGPENENVLAAHATAYGGSGWWYEGGGIYRSVYLGRAPTQVHFVPDGLYAMNNVTGDIKMHSSDASAGMLATAAVVNPRVEVVHDGGAKSVAGGPYVVTFTIMDADGKVVGTTKADPFHLTPGQVLNVAGPELTLENVELWSSARPYMYSMDTVMTSADGNDTVDNVSSTWFGFRRATWTADNGFFLNEQPFKWRGFCDHNDFAGVGTALSERINLYRAQSLRSVGGNSWRMSHNPPVPSLLDVLDMVGVLVWDENRNLGNVTEYIIAQRDMVRRDRNHPSVMCWSFCNEGGCNKGAAVGEIFRTVSKEQDPMRPVTANTQKYGPGDLSDSLEVQGFSHRPGSMFDGFHSKYPDVPTIGSECCSCRTQRGEDVASSGNKTFGNFNGDCLQSQTGVEMSRKFISGILVWTLFDYFGEPSPYDWPHKSSSFGSFDLSGFPKAGAYYYSTWWLLDPVNMSASEHDRIHAPAPFLENYHTLKSDRRLLSSPRVTDAPEKKYSMHIVDHWQMDVGGPSRTIHAYTNAPRANLYVNGKAMEAVSVVWIGYAEWKDVEYSDGNLTAVGLDNKGNVVASHTIMTPGAGVKLNLTIDAPSPLTGTGEKLVLDGHDTALLRASILDSNGQVVLSSGDVVVFSIASGPGKIIGVGNGDPKCHESNTANNRSSYHGLVRAVVKVTDHQATSNAEYHRITQVDAEGNRLTRVRHPSESGNLGADDGITVEASTTLGGKTVTASVTIPTSTDIETHGVKAVARRWMKQK